MVLDKKPTDGAYEGEVDSEETVDRVAVDLVEAVGLTVVVPVTVTYKMPLPDTADAPVAAELVLLKWDGAAAAEVALCAMWCSALYQKKLYCPKQSRTSPYFHQD